MEGFEDRGSADEPPEIDINVLRDPVIELNQLHGVDKPYTFYYDETNNIRRFLVSSEGFNVQDPQVFVLGGIVHEGPPRPLNVASLRTDLRLQPSTRELKFAHVAHGDVAAVLRSRKLTVLLDWLISNALNIHFLALDPLYWATVDIIDAIIPENAPHLLPFAVQLKNDLHRILRTDLAETSNLFRKFDYPNVTQNRQSAFIVALLEMLETQEGLLPHFHHFMLKGTLQAGAKGTPSSLLAGDTAGVLIDEFSSFFLHRICLFKNSQHIFDEEEIVRLALGNRRFVDGGREVRNFRFATSHSEEGIQLSDLIVGLLGKCFSWINHPRAETAPALQSGLDEAQRANRSKLAGLLDRSISACPAFAQHILSLDDRVRGEAFFES